MSLPWPICLYLFQADITRQDGPFKMQAVLQIWMRLFVSGSIHNHDPDPDPVHGIWLRIFKRYNYYIIRTSPGTFTANLKFASEEINLN
jgi:hypothetical protein